MPSPTVSVIVPTFERAAALEGTLAALCSLEYPDDLLEILVVDDGSTDSTTATVARFPRVRYAWQPNRGVASARNHGARLAGGDLLVFVDDDCIVGPDNVRRHVAVREEYEDCVVAGLCEFDPDLRVILAETPLGRFRLWADEVAQTEEADGQRPEGRTYPLTVATGNLSMGRRLFIEIGGFDERFLVGAEDQDLCWRARAAGAKIVRDHTIRVKHNDQHRDLLALCRREERGAMGIVCLTTKHRDFPQPATLALNGPLRRTDSPRVAARKIVRSAMIHPLLLPTLHRLVRAAEIAQPDGGPPLQYLYRALTGLYVFRGVRRGFRLTSGGEWSAGHEPRHRSGGVRQAQAKSHRAS